MADKKENCWTKFVPSLDLPKERVSIAYDTHDERGVRYAYGYFQFYNGTCGCFWKDGNEQPKVVKAEDIKYWMPVPSLDVQEEPVSEQNLSNVERVGKNWKEPVSDDFTKALAECIHQAQGSVVDPMVFAETWKDELIKLSKCEEPVSEDLDKEIDNAHKLFYEEVGWNSDEGARAYVADWFAHYFANWQKQQMMKEAVNGTFSFGEFADGTPIDSIFVLDKEVRSKYKEGDKVKLIIIKED